MQLSWSRVRLPARIAGPFVLGFSILYAAGQPGLTPDVGLGSSGPSQQGGQVSPAVRQPHDGWWQREPIRFLQTNLSETDSTVDPQALVAAVADFGANTFLMNMGGIVAQYPTRVPFHYPSAFLPPGRDLFGDVVREAHARKIRVIGRFDLSKTQQPVFDAHPEWFFRRANGDPVIYNGLYSTCINGDYYREHALTILDEALERYEVDGLFFNMFGNPVDRLQRCGDRSVPLRGLPDALSRPLRPSGAGGRRRRLSRVHGRLVARGRRDDCRADSPQAPARRLPHLHPRPHRRHHVRVEHRGHPAAAAVALFGERQRQPVARIRAGQAGDQPGDELHRLSRGATRTSPQAETALRLYQNIAHGAPPALVVSGPMAQQDRSGLVAAKPIFDWHARHEDLYVGQKNAATGAAARHRRHRVVSRLLPPPDRGAHSVRGVREHALARGRLPLRPRDRAGSAARGARTLRAGRRPAARGRRSAAAVADRRHRRPDGPRRATGGSTIGGAAVAEATPT